LKHLSVLVNFSPEAQKLNLPENCSKQGKAFKVETQD